MTDRADNLDCNQADELLVDYLYQELPKDQSTAFERHLQTCETHAEKLRELRTTLGLFRSHKETLPEERAALILARAHRAADLLSSNSRASALRTRWWSRWIPGPVPLTAMAATVLFTVGIHIYYQSGSGDEQKPFQPEKAFVADSPVAEEKATLSEIEASKPILQEQEDVSSASAPLGTARLSQKPPQAKPKAKPKKESAPKDVAMPPSLAENVYQEKQVSTHAATPEPSEGRLAAKEAEPPSQRQATWDDREAQKSVVADSDAFRKQARSKEVSRPGQAPAKKSGRSFGSGVVNEWAQAEKLMQNQQYGQAALAYERFLKTKPQEPQKSSAFYALAKAWFLADACDKAMTASQQALQQAPKHTEAPETLLNLASCQVRLGKFDQAIQTYHRLSRDFPAYRTRAQREIQRLEQNP